MAVGKRPSPSAAPLEDWPCGVIGSGFTTQRRLRSPTAGVVSSRPLLPVKAGETPLPRHLGRIAAIKLEPSASESPKGRSLRMRCCELEWQSCNARRRDCGSARVWWPGLPTAKPPTRGALPRAFPFLKSPFSLLSKEKRGPPPPEGVKGNFPSKGKEGEHLRFSCLFDSELMERYLNMYWLMTIREVSCWKNGIVRRCVSAILSLIKT